MSGPLRPGEPARPPSVPESMDAERAASGARPKVPISRRYGSGSRSPLPLLGLLVILLLGTVWAHSVWKPSYRAMAAAERRLVIETEARKAAGLDLTLVQAVGLAEPGDRLAAEADAMRRAGDRRAVPAAIVAESELACWRSHSPVVSQAQRYLAENGAPAATFADLGLPDDDSAGEGLSGRVINGTPEFGVGCEVRAASLLLGEAQRQSADYDAWRASVGGWRLELYGHHPMPYGLPIVLWLAMAAWLTRVLVNLRPSIGRNVGIGTAVASLIPLWIVPVYAFGFLGVQTDNLWLQRTLIVLAMVVVAVYFLWTLARVASQVWVGTGLPLGGLSSMLWAPPLLAVECLFLGLLTYTFVEDRPVTTSASTANGIPAIFSLGVAWLLIATVLGWIVYMLVVSIAQHIGIARAVDGTEHAPDDQPRQLPDSIAGGFGST